MLTQQLLLNISLVNATYDLKFEVLFHYLFVFEAPASYSLDPECTEILNEWELRLFVFLFTENIVYIMPGYAALVLAVIYAI